MLIALAGCAAEVGDESDYGATQVALGAGETECRDGVDNDGDFLIDQDDPDCRIRCIYDGRIVGGGSR